MEKNIPGDEGKVDTMYEGDKGITVNMAGPAMTKAYEEGLISAKEYCNAVPPEQRPKKYRNLEPCAEK